MPPQAMFKSGDSVIHRSRQEMGRVEAEPQLEGGEYWYRVQFARRIEHVVEDDLDPVGGAEETLQSLAAAGCWGRLEAVRCALGIERLSNVNRSTIYAFQSQRVLFQPYQYKPLLKVLDSLDRRLLIADEVGLGKTIEAGLILTELEARRPLDRVLVVCPSRLREKWRNELNSKFDQDFDILDKQSFLQAADRAQENPARFRLHAIMSMQSMRGEEVRRALTSALGTVDLVIVDEAHHARNPSTATSELLRELCEIGDCVLLLTATPLHLGSEDLFTLLNALQPTEFRDPGVFDRQLQAHAPVHRASALVRAQRHDRLPEVAAIVKEVFCSHGAPAEQDPRARQLIRGLKSNPPQDRRQWIELERQIQELHPLGSVVTRTRKRDVVENAPTRRARTCYCDWTPEEDEAYQRLVGARGSFGWFREGMSFGQIQRARQAASCLPAAYESQATAATDDDAVELTDILPSEVGGRRCPDPAPTSVYAWSGADSKFAQLRQILGQVSEEEPAAKVLVFTYFRGTARYLEHRLRECGWNALRIDGDVKSDPRRPDQDDRGRRIRQFERDPEIKVLISTEVGSEGLDFQFCHHLVNYDLPWNPMVVEQRIGRIDRFGQESDVVHIHNLVVRNTVEDRILARLYRRIGIFERSIGNLEAILGETIGELRRDFVSGRLTPEEADARVEQAANAIERRMHNLEHLDQEASALFGHEEFIHDEMMRVRKLGRYVSENSILALLRTYFASHHPLVRLKRIDSGIYGFRMTDELRQEIYDAARGGPTWINRTRDGILSITTCGATAFKRKDIDLVNASHPLVRAAIKKLKPQLDSPRARIGQARLARSKCGECDFQEGFYFVLLFAHTIDSIRKRRVMEAIAWNDATGSILDAEQAEQLLYLAIEQGDEWTAEHPAAAMPNAVWERLTSEARKRNQAIRADEKRENDALYVRRQNALKAEFEHNLRIKQRRLDTAERKGEQRILPAMRGQVDKLKADYQAALAELNDKQTVRASLSEPLVACAILVTS